MRKNAVLPLPFSADTEQIARAYNITPQEVIFCYAVASYCPQGDAFRAILADKAVTQAQAETSAKETIKNNMAIKILIQRIRNGKKGERKRGNIKEGEKEREYNIYNNPEEEEKKEIIKDNNINNQINKGEKEEGEEEGRTAGEGTKEGGKNESGKNESGSGDEYTTRKGLISNIIDTLNLVQGKDKVTALVTLAKLQGLDRPEESETDEKRTFFLPWVSNCRTCALMQIYQKAKNR